MQEKLLNLQEAALNEIKDTSSIEAVESLRVKYLGKKGEITAILKEMGKLSAEERPVIGQVANKVRESIEGSISSKKEELKAIEKQKKLAEEVIDVTMPAKAVKVGKKHPISQIIDEVSEIFMGMGFSIAEGPEVETVENNFDALNAPIDHPSRDMSDTFYINSELLLRTQTSPVQVRTLLEAQGKPVKIVCPGKVYRRDDDDATHSHQFMQLEGLVVDKNITMSDLKGTLSLLMKKMFGENRKIRFKPSYFPFTEPSVEVDVSCFKCGGKGCPMCKHTGWIEVLGAGMVHPHVLEGAGYDPKVWKGFAFGAGIERLTMLRHNIDDIRNFYVNDFRFLKQFEGER